MRRTKKTLVRLAGMILLAGVLLAGKASAEMSTNLRVVMELNPSNKKPAMETFVDDAGNPVIAEDKGYASIRYTYTSKNRVGMVELLDTEGNLVNGRDGYARIVNVYSAKYQKEQNYFDAEGNPVNGPDGYARKETKKSQGKWLTMWEYDADGNPVNKHQLIEYYPDGRVKTERWFDVNDNLTAGPEGYARREVTYKSKTKSSEQFFDAEGKPYYYAKAGYASMKCEFKATTLIGQY